MIPVSPHTLTHFVLPFQLVAFTRIGKPCKGRKRRGHLTLPCAPTSLAPISPINPDAGLPQEDVALGSALLQFPIQSLSLDQESINYSPWAKSSPSPASEIKFYWNIARSISLCTVCSCICPTRAELSSCNTDHMALCS